MVKGWGKMIDMSYDTQAIRITSVNDKQVGYWADTYGGASGSPVLSKEDNTVVAIHNLG